MQTQRSTVFHRMASALARRERRHGVKHTHGITHALAKSVFMACNPDNVPVATAVLCRLDSSMPFMWPGNARVVSRALQMRVPAKQTRRRKKVDE